MVADGMGVNSTALLILLKRQKKRPHAILMADTGAEKPQTYAYVEVRQQWLQSVGFPPLTIVRYEPKDFKNWPPYHTLDENCFTNGTLPSLAFGFKSCSQKWKISPQNRWAEDWSLARDCWAAGGRVRKSIGYDAGPADSRRYAHAEGHMEDALYLYDYPLRDASLDRQGCVDLIIDEGLPVPIKSACFMCPALKPRELHELERKQLRAIVLMEARAHPRLLAYAESKGWPKGVGNPIVEGLWRTAVKGVRKGTMPRPGQMTAYIRSEGLLPAAEIDFIWNEVPTRLIAWQEGFARGEHNDELSRFIALLESPTDLA